MFTLGSQPRTESALFSSSINNSSNTETLNKLLQESESNVKPENVSYRIKICYIFYKNKI